MLLGVSLLSALFLAPTLECGYVSDDATHSLGPGREADEHKTALTTYWQNVKGWAKHHGRFFPIAFHFILTFSFLTNVHVYRILILLSILGNMLMFAHFIRRLTGSVHLGAFGALVATLLIQFRFFYDPVLSFVLLMQIVAALVIGSLIALDKYLEAHKPQWFLVSTFCFVLALLTYETTYVCGVLHGLLIFCRLGPMWRRTAKLSAPFLLVPVVFAGLLLLMRRYFGLGFSHGSDPEAVYVVNFSPHALWRAFTIQIQGALPLTYSLLGPFKEQAVPFFLAKLSLETLVFHAAVFACSTALLLRARSRPTSGEISVSGLLGLGFLLTILPAVIIALVPRYQGELFQGVAHIPVYLSYFGVATVFVALLKILLRVFECGTVGRRLIGTCAAGLLATVGVVHYTTNRMVLEYLMVRSCYPRALLERGLRDGLFQNVPEGASLIIAYEPYWAEIEGANIHTRAFFLMNSGLHLNVIKETVLRHEAVAGRLARGVVMAHNGLEWDHLAESDPVFYLDCDSRDPDRGYAILGHVQELITSTGKVLGLPGRSALVYVQMPFFQDQFFVQGTCVDSGGMTCAGNFFLDRSRLKLVSSGPDWQLCEVTLGPDKLMDLRSLKVVYGPLGNAGTCFGALEATYQGGFFQEEAQPPPETNWRWCASRGELHLINPSPRPRKITLAMTIDSGYRSPSHLRMESPLFNETLEISCVPRPFSRILMIPPGEQVIKFACDAKPVEAPGDPRVLVFRLKSISLTEHNDHE
jgi:hypothetical protein